MSMIIGLEDNYLSKSQLYGLEQLEALWNTKLCLFIF